MIHVKDHPSHTYEARCWLHGSKWEWSPLGKKWLVAYKNWGLGKPKCRCKAPIWKPDNRLVKSRGQS